MALATGSRIGPYEITAAIGVGGMGEVYRARDLKLGRAVALKILPEAFAGDADRLARFEREARTLAGLNHPHIAQIYGFEQTGTTHALVMELVEGEDLSQRLARGPLPLDEALPIARQIAEALEAAHEQGIVHRDLKPANIKVRADGTVKVLDFGLAKALEPPGDASVARGLGPATSPTITSPAMTQVGVILGTAAYMSPEQAKGKPADRRSDIWAFGCVLFEMLTARRAFEGEDVSDTLAFILTRPPDLSALPSGLSPGIGRLLRRCLAKDPKQRLADIRDARLELEDIAADRDVHVSAAPARRPSRVRLAVVVLGAMLLAALVTSGVWIWYTPSPPRQLVTRFSVPLASNDQFTLIQFPLVAISRDGSQLAYGAINRLYVRSMDALASRPLSGTEVTAGTVANPVFSPDGQWIAFFASPGRGAIKKIAIGGGSALTICDNVLPPSGMSWDESGILFGQPGRGIMRVAPEGGTPELIVAIDEGEIAQGPRMLPGGTAVLFAATKALPFASNPDMWDRANVFVQPLPNGARKKLIEGGSEARYVSATGHLVFVRAGVMLAAPFDVRRLSVTGGAVPILEGVSRGMNALGAAHFSISDNGSLAFIPALASGTTNRHHLAFVNRAGAIEPLPFPPTASYVFPRLSPDGSQLAYGTDDGKGARVWIYDLAGTTSPRQLTSGGNSRYPVWSSDGVHVAFQSDRDGTPSIYRQRADGTTPAERLTVAEQGTAHVPESWSPDGKYLSFSAISNSGSILSLLSVADKKASRLVDKPSIFPFASSFSPDGTWIAYGFRERSGNDLSTEIYVEPFPRTTPPFLIGAGLRPLWSRDGKELFFGRPGQSFVASVSTTPTFRFGNPVEIPIRRSPPPGMLVREYDVTPDGQRFVFSMPESFLSTETPQIQVVLNWSEELRQRVPVR